MSDFSVYTAEQAADWMSQGTVASPPTSLWVTLFDDTGTELDTNLQNGRVETTTGTDWDSPGTDFDNGIEINWGEATADITVQDVALYDSDTGGSNNEIARYTVNDAPRSISSGTRVFFPAGELSFDIIDRTE